MSTLEALPGERNPDVMDLGETQPWLRPIWRETARGLFHQLLHPTSQRPGEIAPMPPPADPLLGHLREGLADPLNAFVRWHREVGDVVRLRLAGVNVHLLCHPEHIGEVFSDHDRRFMKPMQGRRNLSQVLGNGLLVSEGSFWLRQRRIMQPAFHKQRIDAFADAISKAATDTADRWCRTPADRPFDVAQEMMRLTLRVVQETLLGAAPSADADRIGRAVSVVVTELNRRFRRVIQTPAATARFRRAVGTLDLAVHRMIASRRTGTTGSDLLSMLLQAKDEAGEGMSDRQLRDEVMTIFLAGHETTANALSWTFYLLGRAPEVSRRLRAELDSVLGGRPPGAADVSKLHYTRMVFSEALRLYPPAWLMARTPISDEVVGGYAIPAHSRIFLSPYVTQRHPEFWSDPEGFDPERFRDPKRIHKFAYFPFGGGKRLCIGQSFAMMEGILVLATLCQRVHLELTAGHPVETEPLVTLRPKSGIFVTAKER